MPLNFLAIKEDLEKKNLINKAPQYLQASGKLAAILYKEEKDIAFYKADIEKFLRADSTRFFLFFPEDLHQPCMNTGQSKKVKKVVIKIRAN